MAGIIHHLKALFFGNQAIYESWENIMLKMGTYPIRKNCHTIIWFEFFSVASGSLILSFGFNNDLTWLLTQCVIYLLCLLNHDDSFL